MIRQAIMQLVEAQGFTLPIAYPNVNFDPVALNLSQWLEVEVFENEPVDRSIANDGTVTARGIVQISVCTRPGLGLVQADSVAEQIIQTFPKGTRIQGDVKVTRAPWRMSDIVTDDRAKIPVSISYSS